VNKVWVAVIRAGFVCAYATIAYARDDQLASFNSADTPFLGIWEIVDTMFSNRLGPRDVGGEERDVGTLGRSYDFQSDYVVKSGRKERCRFDRASVARDVPIAALFQKELASKRAPSWVTEKFGDRVRNYRLGSLAKKKLTLYRYDCPQRSTEDGVAILNAAGNWFALAGDTLIFPSGNSWLFVLKRPPKERVPEHALFCEKATTINDKVICGEREMWLMHKVTEDYTSCLIADKADASTPRLEARFSELAREKATCNGDRDCLYNALASWTGEIGRFVSLPAENCKK
jgi:hypothetical protein